MNWLTKGNVMIAPGVERMDTVKTDDGYEMKSVWSRNDLSDTSIMKLSTATGYIYGYVQDLDTSMRGSTIFLNDVPEISAYRDAKQSLFLKKYFYLLHFWRFLSILQVS